MMTAKASTLLVSAYVLALAAGTTSGLLADRLRQSPSTPGSLAEQLQLTPSQLQQMRQIWESTSDQMDGSYRQAQAISRQRDQALFEMLTDEQKAKFAIADRMYNDKFQVLAAQREEVFKDAMAKTEKGLSDWQRSKYEQIVRQRTGRDPLEPATQPSVDELKP